MKETHLQGRACLDPGRPPNPPPLPLAVSVSLFLKPNNKHNHKKQPRPVTTPKWPASVARAARPGRWGMGAEEGGKTSPLQSLCFSFQQALGRGWPCPTGDAHQLRQAGWAQAGLSGQEQTSKPWVTSCSIRSGHQEGARGGHHSPLPWAQGRNGAHLGWEMGQLQLQK